MMKPHNVMTKPQYITTQLKYNVTKLHHIKIKRHHPQITDPKENEKSEVSPNQLAMVEGNLYLSPSKFLIYFGQT